MDGENNGSNPIKMDDLGVTPIFGNTHIDLKTSFVFFSIAIDRIF